jgi:ABC-type multidrug transport system fused ATPase/permease subunit
MARKNFEHKENSPKLSKENYKKALRVFKYIKPYNWLLIIGLLFLVLSSVTTMGFPFLIGKLFGTTDASKVEYNELLDFKNANTVLVLLLIIFVSNAIFSFFRIYLFTALTENVLNHLRKDAFKRLTHSKIAFFDANKVGELSSRIATDINQLQDLLMTTLAEFIRQWITIIISIIIISSISLKLMGIMLAIVPVVVVLVIIFGSKIKKISKKTQNAAADSNVILNEALTSIKSVKVFTNEVFEFTKFAKQTNSIKSLAMKGAIWRGLFAGFIILGLFGAVTVVIWQGILMVQSGEMNNEQLVTFILFTGLLAVSFGSIGTMMGNIQKAVGSTERLMDLLENEVENIEDTQQNALSIKGNVTFENVGFVYETRKDVTVLKDVSFTIPEGQTLAIVGSSGAGKSTIASLIFRFYEPTTGRLLIDDKDAHSYGLSELRTQMAIVPQEVILFAGTIRENIAYGNPLASEEELLDAAKQANALEFINKFPDKMETLVGDRGIQLSGGQKQRIAIARAVLKNPKILVLDEATSSLDSESEKLVQDALFKLMENRTSIVIAHRLSTIRNANKIIVLDKGIIIESGKHAELIEKNGVYAKMSKMQFDIE